MKWLLGLVLLTGCYSTFDACPDWDLYRVDWPSRWGRRVEYIRACSAEDAWREAVRLERCHGEHGNVRCP